MRLDDKITIALNGPIHSHKELLAKKALDNREILFRSLEGNYWVPKTLTVVKEEQDKELFEKYSDDPDRYSFEFQMSYMASRLEQQTTVDNTTGLVLLGQPLEVDREIYAEANKDNIGEAFSTYERVHEQVKRRVPAPDIRIHCRIKEEDLPLIIKRIKQSGSPGEKKLLDDIPYLVQNIRLNEQFFEEVRGPVVEVDATHPFFDGEEDDQFLMGIYSKIAEAIKEHKSPLRITSEEWEAVDHNQAIKAVWEANRQLKRYLRNHQKILTIAANVSSGKTDIAEMLRNYLEIDALLELEGRNDEIKDELLSKFLMDKPRYCYDLQKYLIGKRITARKEYYERGRSFVEDRTPVEDQSVFWLRFLEQGHLTQEQFEELQEIAKLEYEKAPKSDLMLQFHRSPLECRKMSLKRGRREELLAWRLPEMKALDRFYKKFMGDMDQYGSHKGPALEFDLHEINPDNEINRGFIFQEIHHSLIGIEYIS